MSLFLFNIMYVLAFYIWFNVGSKIYIQLFEFLQVVLFENFYNLTIFLLFTILRSIFQLMVIVIKFFVPIMMLLLQPTIM
jgi:hypothetical protein